jgi:hypothetical protein
MPVSPPAQDPATSAMSAETAAKLQEQIHAYLDSLKVGGAFVAGGRVLLNDKVYRLHEIVERTLQLRLIKVESNALTFSDANGATYVRYF